ncbi:MAG: NifU family protein [Rhodospirillales bacterium]|nr:NifU family protein [Rhodospirillales bacterium]
MFIQTEATPNPATLKFLPGSAVMESGTANFTVSDEAARSPLAQRLFAIEGVAGVFLGNDFITATKFPDTDWDILKPRILSAIMDHYTSGDPVVNADAMENAHAQNDDQDALVAQICELLDTRVRPAVAQDGGDIMFKGFENGIVYLTMQGACAGCPSSSATLKHGIENMLKYYIPEILEVRAAE